MGTRLVIGNLLKDATVTMTPAADSNFPEAFLSDGPGQMGARFSSLAANPQIIADFWGNAQIPYIDGSPADSGDVIATNDPEETLDPEYADLPWTVEATPDAEAGTAHLQVIGDGSAESPDHSGNGFSLFVVGGDPAGGAIARVRFTLRAGAQYKMEAWAQKGNDDEGDAKLRLYSPETGNYLAVLGGGDGFWASAPYDLVDAGTYDGGATWYGIAAGSGVRFTTEGFKGDTITLELQLLLTLGTSTQARFDGIVISPAVDFMGIFGNHNIPTGLAPVWESSDDGTSWTNRATFDVARHQFWKRVESPVYARFHRLAMTGTPLAKVFLGDLVLGLADELEREPQDPIDVEFAEPGQQRLETPGGSRRIANRGPYPPRRLTMRFRFPTRAEQEAVKALLVDRIRGGAESVVVLPANDLGPSAAVYGDADAGWSVSHQMAGAFQPDGESREFYSDATFVVTEGAGFEMLD